MYQYIMGMYRGYKRTPEKYCRAPNEMRHMATTYLCLLENVRKHDVSLQSCSVPVNVANFIYAPVVSACMTSKGTNPRVNNVLMYHTSSTAVNRSQCTHYYHVMYVKGRDHSKAPKAVSFYQWCCIMMELLLSLLCLIHIYM